MIQFNAKHLKALMPVKAGVNDHRYYMNSIHIEPHAEGGVVLVASNGHARMCIRDLEAQCGEAATFTISADAAKFCGRRGVEHETLVEINPITERLVIRARQSGDERFIQPGRCLIVGQKYPEWQRVIPRFSQLKTCVADEVNVDYYVLAARVHPAPANDLRAARTIRLWQESPNGCVAVEYIGAPNYLMIIMPRRNMRPPGDALVDWIAAFGEKNSSTPTSTTKEGQP